MPGGRPTDYCQEVADAICERLVLGESLRSICRDPDMPAISAVFRWLGKYPEFEDQYVRAREEQAETFADEIVAISDEQETEVVTAEGGKTLVVYDKTAVARNRLRVDARKWVASKLKPKKYGDKLELSGNKEAPLIVNINRLTGEG